jgi:hypothetical protein
MRTIPLYWSPLPSTLDGFVYVTVAEHTLARNAYPIADGLRADFFVLTLLTSITSSITGKAPLYVIQPMVSVIGAAIVLVGVAMTRRLGFAIGWPTRRVRYAALVPGLLLAVQGLFLRRTTVPDPEVLGILLTLLSVIAFDRILRAGDDRWLVPFGLLLVTFPILHIFSTFNAAVALTALWVLLVAAHPSRRPVLFGGLLLLLFWGTFVGYYEAVQRLDLFTVTYVGRVQNYLGLFVAWVIAITIGAAWLQRTSTRAQRLVFTGPLLLLFVVVLLNVFRPVYPGTVQSPPEVAILISLLAVPVLFAGYAAPVLSARNGYAPVVLATLAGPLVIVYFSLTASLTPDYFATVMRTQTFMHVSAFVLVGIGAVAVAARGRGVTRQPAVRVLLVCSLVVCTLLTVPLALVALDTLQYPATTAESELAAADHATTYLDGAWATDQVRLRIAGQTGGANVTMEPTRTWLSGGPPPDCAVLSMDSWTTHGAHFWPAAPQTIAPDRYETTLTTRQVVYTSSGRDPLVVSLPSESAANC